MSKAHPPELKKYMDKKVSLIQFQVGFEFELNFYCFVDPSEN